MTADPDIVADAKPIAVRPRELSLLHIVDRAAESLVIAALLGELLLVLVNVATRSLFHTSFLWADEMARFALSMLAFIGGAVAYRRREHAFVRVVVKLLPARIHESCLALADVLVLFTAGLVGIASVELIASIWSERTPILQLPAALIALPLPVGIVLLALYALAHLRREHARLAWQIGAAFGVVLALAFLTRQT